VLFPACVLLLLASVPLSGGRLAALADLRLRAAWLLGAALCVQVAVISLLPGGAPELHRGLHLASYGLAGAFLAVNRRVRGLFAIGLGGACNLAAIAANGGVMPMSRAAARAAGISGSEGFSNSEVLRDPALAPLGDVLAVPGMAFSPGDVLILAGAAALLHTACGTRLGLGLRPRAARAAGG